LDDNIPSISRFFKSLRNKSKSNALPFIYIVVPQFWRSKRSCNLIPVETWVCNDNLLANQIVRLIGRNLACLGLLLLNQIPLFSGGSSALIPNESFATPYQLFGETGTTSIYTNQNRPIITEDNENPVAICQDIFLQLDSTGNASITAAHIDNGSTDNCGIASMSLDMMVFTSSDEGENTVTLTVTDSSGNFSTCTATVTVLPYIDFTPCLPVIDIDASLLANDPHENDFNAGMKIIADGLVTYPEVISFNAGEAQRYCCHKRCQHHYGF
jgi:hypothetical protein